MGLLTIKEVADRFSISYEAARLQIQRYSKELDDYIIKQGKRTLIDEEGVKVLEERRRTNTVIIEKDTSREKIEMLTAELEAAKKQVFELQQKVISLTESKQELIEKGAKCDLLLEDRAKQEKEISEARQEIERLKVENQAAKEEAASYQKSIFGFYRKRG